ncbi:GL21104 [Drosophila persimilis]|uniref:GL21104 n=1 Tax=Drosophila persimilis TaxID=7234 RepID=B4GWW8_DROPE|nr:GL21104 [Drosophila persimilis]
MPKRPAAPFGAVVAHYSLPQPPEDEFHRKTIEKGGKRTDPGRHLDTGFFRILASGAMERRGEWGLFSRRSDAEAHLIEITRVDGSRRALWKGGGEAAFPRPRDASRVHVLEQSRLGLHKPRHDGRIRAATITGSSGATGAPGTLIKTGQSRSLAKDVACIPPSYDRLPELAAAGVRQDYPFLGELAEASKRLLFWTDVSSHQAIIRARVDGNEHVDLEEVTTLALGQQSDIPCVSIKIRASMHISQVSAFGRFVSDDKTGLERSAITPVCTVAQSVSTSAWPAGYDTQYSRRMLVPDSDALMLLEGKENYGVYPDR